MPRTILLRSFFQKTDWRSVFLVVASTAGCAATPTHAAGMTTLDTPQASPAALPSGGGGEASGAGDGGRRLAELPATKRFCNTGPQAAIVRGQALFGAALVAQSEVLPNPTLTATHAQSLSGERDFETNVGITIPLGIGGARWLLQDAAVARQAQNELQASHNRMMAALTYRGAFVRASLSRARLAQRLEQQKRYEDFIAALTKLEGGGESAQLDLDRLRVEAELSAVGAAKQRRELDAQQAWLEAVIDSGVALTEDLELLAGGAAAVDAENETSQQIAALEQSARASTIEADAARRRAVPDVKLYAGYRTIGGETIDTGHGFQVGLSFPLTFFDHGQGDAQRAEAKATVANAQVERRRRMATANIAAAKKRLAALASIAPRIDKALELAQKTEDGERRLYLADEASLLDVLQAANRRAQLELALIDIAEAKADALLTLARARGHFAETELDRACAGSTP